MLTVAQFVIALAMLVGTVVIYNQMRFIEHKDLGVDRSQMACVSLPADSSSLAGSKAFCEALRHEAGIRGVTVGSGLPEGGASMSSTTAYSEGKKREFMCNYFFIDPQFLPLLHISLTEGRNLSDSFPTDKKEGFLVNEAFVKNMGWKSAIGQSLEGGGCKGKVVGVMKNFFFKSLHNVIEPAIMIYNTNNPLVAALVKAPPQQLPRMKEIWKQYFPSQPFDYFFMDESFNEQYKQDRITLLLFNAFAGLAIFISCLGLYGLVSLITVQRTKEIGIRKVLGASLPQLVSLFTTDLMKLVAWAAGIALPLAGLAMFRWLSSYAYHTTLNAWMFILPVGVILVLALTVTALRIIRTALANPVESLRTD
jgi:putative ABC transport system permease protein